MSSYLSAFGAKRTWAQVGPQGGVKLDEAPRFTFMGRVTIKQQTQRMERLA